MPEYQQPYGFAALITLGRLLEYHLPGYGDVLQTKDSENEQQRKWHPGWDVYPSMLGRTAWDVSTLTSTSECFASL